MPKKHVFAVLSAGMLAVLLLTGCGGAKGQKAGSGEPVVIRISHNIPGEVDPDFRDPVTGEMHMGQQEAQARLWAQQQVLEKLNVKLQWIPYFGALEEEVLRSVIAGDPYADIVRITGTLQGALLSQNVLQPLDEYESLFADEDSGWLFLGKVYGHHFFLQEMLSNGPEAPLVYNIGMLNKVAALKENGKTVLPVDL